MTSTICVIGAWFEAATIVSLVLLAWHLQHLRNLLDESRGR